MVFVPGYAVASTLFCIRTEYVERAKRGSIPEYGA